MPSRKATHQHTKEHNRDLVFKTIIDHQVTSRAEIARITKLTRATVSDIVTGLMVEGLVREIGTGESTGGKPSILLSLVPDARYLIGLNISQEKFIGSVVNLSGEIKATAEVPVESKDSDLALKAVTCILDELLATEWKPVVGIGVGAPGLINTREGILINSVNLEWRDLPLARLLGERYHLPVSILNDSQATAIGEYIYGDHDGSNLVVINVRHGIGSGILINGQLFQGDGGSAGEIGHIVIQENGQLCRCGRSGCLETLASTRAVVQRVQQRTHADAPVTLEQVQQMFAAGNPEARAVVREAGEYLGKTIGAMVGILNIEKVILTGDLTIFGDFWLDAIRQAMQSSALARITSATDIQIGKLDYRACILGSAAQLLLDNYSLLFRPPEAALRSAY